MGQEDEIDGDHFCHVIDANLLLIGGLHGIEERRVAFLIHDQEGPVRSGKVDHDADMVFCLSEGMAGHSLLGRRTSNAPSN